MTAKPENEPKSPEKRGKRLTPVEVLDPRTATDEDIDAFVQALKSVAESLKSSKEQE